MKTNDNDKKSLSPPRLAPPAVGVGLALPGLTDDS